MLAAQGRLDIAGRYLKGDYMPETILRDRLYHAGTKPAGSRPPTFPFERINVTAYNPGAGAAASAAAFSGVAPTAATARTVQPSFAAGSTLSVSGAQQQQPQRVASMQSQPQSQPAQNAAALPPGWLELKDQTGRPYYVNQATGQSQWEPPAPLAPVVPAVQSVPQSQFQKSPIGQQQTQQSGQFPGYQPQQQHMPQHSQLQAQGMSMHAGAAAMGGVLQPHQMQHMPAIQSFPGQQQQQPPQQYHTQQQGFSQPQMQQQQFQPQPQQFPQQQFPGQMPQAQIHTPAQQPSTFVPSPPAPSMQGMAMPGGTDSSKIPSNTFPSFSDFSPFLFT